MRSPGIYRPSSILFLLFICALVLSACVKRFVRDELAVVASLSALQAADNRSDLESVLELYTSDAILMPPDRSNIIGHRAIRQHYTDLFERYDLTLRFEVDDLIVVSDKALVMGTTKGYIEDLRDLDLRKISDRFIIKMRRIDEQWLVQQLIWNRSPS